MKKNPSKKRGKNTTRSKASVAKKPHPTLAKLRFQELKPFVNFKFDGDKSTADKIRRIYRKLEPLIKQPHVAYKSRSRANLAVALRDTGATVTTRSKWLKAVPVPTNDIDEISVRVSRGKLIKSTDTVTAEHIHFNKKALAKRGADYVRELVKPYSERTLFQIQTGEFHMERPVVRDLIPEEVAKLQQKYSVGNVIELQRGGTRKIGKGNSWRKWLNGLTAYTSKNQITARAYLNRQEKEKRANYKKRKQKRRKREIG